MTIYVPSVSDSFCGGGTGLGLRYIGWTSRFPQVSGRTTNRFIMEVINDNSAMLSNYEVYNLLQDIQTGKNGQQKPNKFQNNLATISYSTLKFLEKTSAKHQSADVIANFMHEIEAFNLTKAEKLHLLNQRPTSAVEIQLLIEESEERMTEQQIGQILDIVNQCIPAKEEQLQVID